MGQLRDVPFAIGEPGRLAAEVRVGAPLGASIGSDIELAEHAIRGVAVRAASARGLSHRHRGTERQDAFVCCWDEDRGVLLVAVADGVGSKKRSREASTAAVRLAAEAWERGNTDLIGIVLEVNDHLMECIPRDERGYRVGATTLTLAEVPVEDGRLGNANVAWVGDTPVWTLSDGNWAEVTPQDDAADGFAAPISALPARNLSVLNAVAPTPGGAIFVMTDGVGNAIRNSVEVRAALAGWWAAPPGIYTFGAQVEFARISFVDDRTVVGIWAQSPGEPPLESGERREPQPLVAEPESEDDPEAPDTGREGDDAE